MKGQCLKEYSKYTILNVLGMIGLSCYILADTFFVANGLGSNGLAALNLAIPVYSFVHGIGLMMGMGGATRYTILKSQGRENRGNAVFTHTVLLALCFAVLLFTVGIFGSDSIARLLGADEAVFEMCRTYLKVLLLFSPMFLLNEIMLCFVRNDGAPQLSMAAMLAGSFANIILDYLFIFPMKMGIFGAVLATGLAPVISIGILSPFLLKKRNQFHLVKAKPNPRLLGYIFEGGTPSLVAELSSGIVMIVFNTIILGLLGNMGVAAYGVIANLSLVVLAIYTGIAQGIQPLLSKYYGKGEKSHIRLVFRYALITVTVLSAIIYLAILLGADGIVSLFNSEGSGKMQAIAVGGMRIYFIACVFAGLNIVMSIYFTSTDRAKPANVISLLRGLVVILPMAFLLSFLWGMTGLWFAFPITEILVGIVGMLLLTRNGRAGKIKRKISKH